MANEQPGIYGTGQWVGTYALLSLKRADASRLLDPLLELAPPAAGAHPEHDEHPVYLALGRHTDVRGSWPVFRSFAIAYNEAFVLLPHVRFRGGSRPFVYLSRLYLDQWWPTALGLYVFGFNKNQRHVENSPPYFTIRQGAGTPALWSATTAPVEHGAADKQQAERAMEPVYSAPFVANWRALGMQCPLASWMSYSDVRTEPVTMELVLADPYLRDLGWKESYRFGGSGQDGSAMHVEYKWTLSFPARKFDR